MNMRKIIAVLAAALMLCAAIPMGALSVSAADAVFSIDWNDGELKFDKGEIAVGPDGSNCYKWTTAGGWSATYMVIHDMDPAKDYTVTFKAKGSVAANMGVTIQNGDWGSYWNATPFAVTTEWSEVVWTMPAGSIPFTAGAILFKWQDTGVAMDLYIDDFVITEGLPKVPLCENGDFESGKEGWTLEQSTVIDATAARSGNYGAHLIGGANWNTMLDRTFDVVAGKNYELSFWAKVVSGGTNIKYLDQNWQGAPVAGGAWFNKTEWTQITVPFTAISNKFYFQFCGAGDMTTEMYVDDVKLIEIKDPSFDGYIYNGDFETGKTDHWTNLWGSSVIELVEGMNGDYALKGIAPNAWNQVYQEVSVTPNTNYTVWAYAKDASNSALWIKNAGGNGDITNKAFAGGSDWSLTSLTFNSGDNTSVWVGLMGLEAGATYTVDDVFMFEAKAESNDGYIKNGDFETGAVSPWDNLWGSCPTVEIIKGGKDSNFALSIVSGEWKHVRQTNIAVEANTDYKVSAWVKNVKDMALLVKDNGDTGNLLNKSFTGADDEWTLLEYEFNSGDNTAILFSLMGCSAEAHGIFDDIKIEKIEAPACEHEYDDCLDADCNLCGETREPGHNLTYFEAVVATNCQETSHDEYWYCENCGCYFGDAEASWQHNPGWLFTPGECVRPEGAADCAIVPCEVCGNDVYGYGEHDVLACQGGTCSKCGENIEGYGCQNYDTPACEDGVCYYCGGFVAGFGHENGATAPCVDGECAYGCGLTYPATEDHVDADADDYCDNCWNHLACIDEDADGWCDVCWSEMPVADDIVYGDADGDGDITLMDATVLSQYLSGYEVTLDEAAADADGDGDITLMDATVLSQYLSGYDVTLGPQG